MKIVRNIDTVTSVTADEFENKYFRPQRPLLIKGFSRQTPADKKWSIEYLKAVCGDVNVDIFDSKNKNSKGSAFTKADLKMPFGDYVEILARNEPSSLRIFLFNMFRHKPELRKDFPCPKIFEGMLGKIGYMFFGSRNTKVRIHQDIDMSSVLLTQFHGRKKVLLVSPKYSDLLYRLPFNTYSLIDPDNPDLKKYPGLEFVEAQECILEAGDALFMPSGYWHYITYIDGGFAVSYRRLAPKITIPLKGFLNIAFYMPVDKLLNRLFDEKWLMRKEKIAEERAHKAVVKILLESEHPYAVKNISHV